VAWWISGEVDIYCVKSSDEGCLECPNFPFHRVMFVDVWWYQLVLDIFLTE
jgi:hypothetical protein